MKAQIGKELSVDGVWCQIDEITKEDSGLTAWAIDQDGKDIEIPLDKDGNIR